MTPKSSWCRINICGVTLSLKIASSALLIIWCVLQVHVDCITGNLTNNKYDNSQWLLTCYIPESDINLVVYFLLDIYRFFLRDRYFFSFTLKKYKIFKDKLRRENKR